MASDFKDSCRNSTWSELINRWMLRTSNPTRIVDLRVLIGVKKNAVKVSHFSGPWGCLKCGDVGGR